MRTTLRVAKNGERRPLVDNGVSDKTSVAQYSRSSQSVSSSRDSRRREAQIEVPLTVLNASPSTVSQAKVISPQRCGFSPGKPQSLDQIAQARLDLMAPLPPQMDTGHLGRSGDGTSYRPAVRQFSTSTSTVAPAPGTLRCASQAPSFDTAMATYSNPVAASSTMETSVAKLQQEQQLREWGEGLSRQVNALAYEKARLEQNITAEALTKRQMEEEVKRLKQRCSELERNDGGSRISKENEDLRKQLAAYAVEIDALRVENEKLIQSRRDAQDAVNQLTDELEGMQNRIGSLERAEEDLQQVRSELRKLEEEAHGQSAKSNESDVATQLQKNIVEEREKSKLLAACLKATHELLGKLQEDFVKQTEEFKHFVSCSKDKQLEAHEQLQTSTRALEKQQHMVKLLHEHFSDAWRQHGESKRRWQDRMQRETSQVQVGASERAEGLVALERRRAQEELTEKLLEHAKEKEDLESRLLNESTLRRKCEEELHRQSQPQRERNNKRQRRLGMNRSLMRLERALQKNIARDMYEVHQGTVLEKVHDRNCRREPRLVVVWADEMQMRWSKDLHASHGRFSSCLDLYEVTRIHFGSMARACVLHTEVPPWRCFSLHTPRRSYDFCCPDEVCVQRFVLSLSRLCDWASGAITTRSHFVALKGWCKLEDYCFREQISLGRLFLGAFSRIREAPGKLGDPQSPSPAPPLP